MDSTEDKTQAQQQFEVIRQVLRSFFSAYKNNHLYGPSHPSSAESIRKFVASAKESLKNKLELPIQHVDGIFLIEDNFFVDDSLFMYDILRSLEYHGISTISLLPGLSETEAKDLIAFLLTKSEDGESQVPFPPTLSGNKLRLYRDSGKGTTSAFGRERTVAVQKAYAITEEWKGRTQDMLAHLFDEQTLPIADLSSKMEDLIETLYIYPAAFSIVTTQMGNSNLHLDHTVRSLIFSLFIGQKLGFDTPSLKLLGLTALCHDVGRFVLPADFQSGTPILPSDVELVQIHVRDGATILSNVQGIPMVVSRVALEHHIGYDGLGYPQLPPAHKTHLFSRIVGLADFVSWGTVSESHYQKPIPFLQVDENTSSSGRDPV